MEERDLTCGEARRLHRGSKGTTFKKVRAYQRITRIQRSQHRAKDDCAQLRRA